MISAFGVDHGYFSKAASPSQLYGVGEPKYYKKGSPQWKIATKRQKAAKAEETKRRAAAGALKTDAVKDPKAMGEQAAAKGAETKAKIAAATKPASGLNRPLWEITRSQTKNWAIGAGLAGAALYGAKKLGDRNDVSKASDRDRTNAATALGGLGGLVGAKTARNVGGWVAREQIKDYRERNWVNSEHRKYIEAHNEKHGVKNANPDKTFEGKKSARTAYYRSYPTEVPGGRAQRLLSWEGSKGVKGTVLAGGTLAGAAGMRHYAQKRERVNKREPRKRDQRKRIPDWASPIIPASTVRSYDNAQAHKAEAGIKNFATKTAGTTVGGAAGLGLAVLAGKKIPMLRDGIKVGTKKPVSGGLLRGWTQSGATAGLGGVGGAVAGSASLKHIQENPRYRYQS